MLIWLTGSPGFSYQALPADDPRVLRVLNIAPGEGSSTIICALELVAGLPHDDEVNEPGASRFPAAEYEALSYCWGDLTKTLLITLNNSKFGISQNLEAALRHLRKPDVERTVWVDAICINQGDDDEKKREVARMRAIYHSAQCVVVWFGTNSADSDAALDFAESLFRVFQNYCISYGVGYEGEGNFDWIDGPDSRRMVEAFLSAEHVESWKSLHRLFRRAWFGRAWTLQELVVSRRAVTMCGNRSVGWEVIELAAEMTSLTFNDVHNLANNPLQPKPKRPSHWALRCCGIRASRTGQLSASVGSNEPCIFPSHYCSLAAGISNIRSEHRFLDDRNLLNMTGQPATMARAESASSRLALNMSRGCSLPHDKIFSVLGILPPALRNAIVPNYSEPARLTFKKAVKACVETTGWLNIICHSHYSPWYPKDHPSWLPDWTRLPRTSVLAERNRTISIPHDPVSNTQARASFSDDLAVLTAEGFIVGTVKTLRFEESFFPNMEMGSAYMAMLPDDTRHWRDATYPTDPAFQYIINPQDTNAWYEPDPSYWNFEPDFRAMIGSIIAQLQPPYFDDFLDLFLRRVKEIWDESQTASPNFGFVSIKKENEALFQNFYSKVRGHMMSRTIFQREDGGFGIGPDFTKTGDLVCLLLGCDAPVILRRREGGHLMFVGDAHAPGFMDGEGMKGIEEGKYTFLQFNIA
jgi:hypothetical protein